MPGSSLISDLEQLHLPPPPPPPLLQVNFERSQPSSARVEGAAFPLPSSTKVL